MQLRKYRWSRDYESAEEELQQLFQHKKIAATSWHADEFQEFTGQSADYDRQLWCAEGSIVFTVYQGSKKSDTGGRRFSLQPGDALEIPAGMYHSAIAGFTGAVCYESDTSH